MAQWMPTFPDGHDPFFDQPWLTMAIDSGSWQCVRWIIQMGVDVNFRDSAGFTPVHSCIERETEDRFEILALLLGAGADINVHGVNGWTPLHLAAVRDDHEMIRILLEEGADRSIEKDIDNCETAEQEARNWGKVDAANIIQNFER